MDHLPYPRQSPHQRLRVRCYLRRSEEVNCSQGTNYAGLFVEQWARRTTIPQLTERSLNSCVREMQHWLYFGLISWAIGRPIKIKDFSQDDFVVATKLPRILRANQDTIQVKTNFEKVLHFVVRELLNFTVATEKLRLDQSVRLTIQCVILSIRTLTDSLWLARRNCAKFAASNFMRYHESYKSPFSAPGINCDVLRRRMRYKDGWCKATVSKILTDCTTATAYYLSSLPRSSAVKHQNCSDSECRLFVDESNYQQAHSITCQHEGCRMVEAPLDEVLRSIEQGGIPLMKLVGSTIKVRKAQYGDDYTAITHVWFGGLGNPESNAMWLCQLKEITNLPRLSKEKIASHDPPRGPQDVLPGLWSVIMDPSRLQSDSPLEWFWIDTLCLPRSANKNDKRHQDLVWERRQDSINRMTQIYAAASSAIVLDTELQKSKFRVHEDDDDNKHDLLAAFARTLCSGWMTRGWTYQEAAMASELLVQHKDGPFVLSIARTKVMRRSLELLQQGSYNQIDDMMDEMSVWFSRLPGTRDDQRFRAREAIAQVSPEIFARIWNDLGERTTSRPIDKIQIFSLLVDIAPTDLLGLPQNVRLKAIIKAQPTLPLALLFQRPLTYAQLSEIKKQQKDEEKADIDRGVLRKPAPEDKTYPLPTRIRSERFPSHLGWMKRDNRKASYIYFNMDLINKGSTLPSLFSLGNIIFNLGLTYRAQIGTSNCFFDICFGSQGDCSLVSERDQIFLMVSSEMSPKNLLAAPFREFEGTLMCLHDGAMARAAGSRRPERIRHFRRLCSVLCNSFGAKASNGLVDTPFFKAVRQKWVDDCEYRIDCGSTPLCPDF